MLTVRLPVQTEEELNDFCERNRITKSQAVKEALAMYMENNRVLASPYELGADLFGQEGSGQKDASTTYKTQLKKMLDEKYTH
jgi:predicted DNA-binding protein